MSDDGQIRVVFFHISHDSFGGGSQMLLRLLKNLDTERFDPIVLAQYEDEFCKRAQRHKIPVRIVPFRGILDSYNKSLLDQPTYKLPLLGLRIGQFVLSARSLLSSADVIWCQNIRALLTILPYVLFSRTPTIWNIGLGERSTGLMRRLNSIALFASDYVFIESEAQAMDVFSDRQLSRYKEKFVIFYKGIDTEEFKPSSDDANGSEVFRVGTAALLVPRKGLDQFIDCAEQIIERRSDVHFYIAGDTPRDGDSTYERRLRRRVKGAGIEDRVHFLGWVEEMPAYLNSLDLFVLPSHNEGIPGSVREALSTGLPVVATDVGGTSEVVINGKTGILVQPGETSELVEAVTHILENREVRKEMGARGRDHVTKSFSLKGYVDRYEMFLQRIERSKG
ncbi:glycosyltransferase family 4 protein [Natronorarus salvus]|uniref:glycosyltransferase family 4 protein n=1 Tax=Natronorarus salvus TaxID=3117733 RepID=UPI002F26C450